MSRQSYQTEWLNLPPNEEMAREGEELHLFHITAKGLEDSLLYFDEDDYHKIINISAICAQSCKTIILAYSHMSNHSHYVVACGNEQDARQFMNRSKRMYSQYCLKKHGINNIQRRTGITIKTINDLNYLRSCIAYVLRNPVEAKIVKYADQYKWSSCRCYFSYRMQESNLWHPISVFSKRALKVILGTHADMTGSTIMLDSDGNVIPETFVDYAFVENLFGNSQENMVRKIMKINYYTMEFELAYNCRNGHDDLELLTAAQKISSEWFKKELDTLSLEERVRMIGIMHGKHQATPSQICRVLNLPQKFVRQILTVTS